MNIAYDDLLILHAIMGTIGLIAGLASAILKKGSKKHSFAGRIFGIVMIAAGVSAIILALWHPNPFLLGIGFFTLFLVSSGWLWMRRIAFPKKIRQTKIIGAFGLISAVYMIYVGVTTAQGAIVLYVFAGILSAFAFSDLFVRSTPKQTAQHHGGRMGGALIAAITAFLATNATFLPPLVIWLAPTIIGSPMIALGIRRYYKNLRPKRKTS